MLLNEAYPSGYFSLHKLSKIDRLSKLHVGVVHINVLLSVQVIDPLQSIIIFICRPNQQLGTYFLSQHNEFLNTLEMTDVPSHEVTVEEGAYKALTKFECKKRNYQMTRGTRVIVRKMFESSSDLEIIICRNVGYRILFPRIDSSPTDSYCSIFH